MDEASSSTGETSDPLAAVLAHIVVYFDCNDTLKPHSAVDIQQYFLNSDKCRSFSELFSDINLIRRALLNKHGRDELKVYYNIGFIIYRSVEDIIATSTFTSTTGYRMKFLTLGTAQSNLVREFRGMSAAASAKCTKDQRVQAIARHIQTAMTLGEALKTAIPSTTCTPSPTFESTFTSATRSATKPIDLVDYDHFKTYSVQEKVKIICELFDAAGLSAEEKVVKYLMTDVISRNIIMTNVESEVVRETNGLRRQMQEEGLDKTTTYCKAYYNKPVGIVAEQIQRVKSNCPLFFSVILKTVCAVSFNDNYSAALKQKSSMDSMILANNKNSKSTTHDDLIRRCFRHRTPAALTGLLHKVSELYVLAAPV
jgi:hypothetical protein